MTKSLNKLHDNRLRVHFHVTEFNDGGIETSLMQWLRILDRTAYRLSLSVIYPSPALATRFRKMIPQDVPVEVLAETPWRYYFQSKRHQARLGKLGRVARDLHNALVVRPHIASRMQAIAADVDLIVDFDLSLRRIAGQLAAPCVGVSHFSIAARLGSRQRRIRRMAKQYAGYGCLAVLSEDMADEAVRILQEDPRRLMFLPNPVDSGWIEQRALATPAVTAPCSEPYIVSVARLDEIQKDHSTLLRAYAEMVKDARINEHLVFVGDGAFRGHLQALARELGISGRVHFMGLVDNPYPVMARASLQVLSSKYEGMPMVLIEGLALGKAIVATDCPTGPRDVLQNGEAGVLVPLGDVAALADAMKTLLVDDAQRHALSIKARARASFYDATRSNLRLAECFRKATGKEEVDLSTFHDERAAAAVVQESADVA